MANKPRKYRVKKQYKGKSKKRMGISYPDQHSFKFMQNDTSIFSAQGNNGGLVGAPTSTGPIALGVPTRNPNGLFSFAGSFKFQCAQAVNFAAQAPLFDRVKVNKIQIKIIPEINVADAAGTALIPMMRIIHDYDDSLIPTSVQNIWARRGKNLRLDKIHVLEFIPRVKYFGAVDSGAVSLNLIQKTPYMDCLLAAQIPLYGLKFAVKDFYGNSTNNSKIRFEVTYYLTFKEQLNNSLTSNIQDYGVSLQGDEVIYAQQIDLSGNITDASGTLLYTADASGNLSEVVLE